MRFVSLRCVAERRVCSWSKGIRLQPSLCFPKLRQWRGGVLHRCRFGYLNFSEFIHESCSFFSIYDHCRRMLDAANLGSGGGTACVPDTEVSSSVTLGGGGTKDVARSCNLRDPQSLLRQTHPHACCRAFCSPTHDR